ncbi:unnamed protein product, partial [Ranitomeya imitator]
SGAVSGSSLYPQVCSEQREALRALHQVQKLLTDHEASYLRGVRTLSRRLNQLRGQLQRREDKDSCPQLKPPRHGRILGRKLKLGHELHVLCDPGYQLSGSESRTCTENQTWSGQPAVCSGNSESVARASCRLQPTRRPQRCVRPAAPPRRECSTAPVTPDTSSRRGVSVRVTAPPLRVPQTSVTP